MENVRRLECIYFLYVIWFLDYVLCHLLYMVSGCTDDLESLPIDLVLYVMVFQQWE